MESVVSALSEVIFTVIIMVIVIYKALYDNKDSK